VKKLQVGVLPIYIRCIICIYVCIDTRIAKIRRKMNKNDKKERLCFLFHKSTNETVFLVILWCVRTMLLQRHFTLPLMENMMMHGEPCYAKGKTGSVLVK
jgi:hypothetical protein